MSARRCLARLLDRLTGLMPNVRPIVFDWSPERQQAANLRAELATRGTVTAAGIQWDAEPIPYSLTDKATA